MTILPGDILIGGDVGFIDHIRADGTLVDQLSLPDEGGEPVRANGIDIGPDGTVYLAKAPSGAGTAVPHDVAYIPDGSGVLRIVQTTPGVAELWKYDASDGELLKQWSIETDDGWTTGLMRLDVAADSSTVFYTDSGRTIFRFSIGPGVPDAERQMEPFDQLPVDSPNIYAGFTLLPDGGLVIAMSKTGDGPRNAICLDGSRTAFWTDEVSPTGEYHIYKRDLDANGDMIDVYPKPGHLDYPVTSLACRLAPQSQQGLNSFSYDPNGPTAVDPAWVADVAGLLPPVSGGGPPLVRCAIVEPTVGWGPDPGTDPNVAGYDSALAVYRAAGFQIFVLFPPEFHLGDPAHWNDPLDGDFTNPFITEFSDLVAGTASAFQAGASHVRDFIVWNEPNGNVGQTYLDEAHFAALLYQCRKKMAADLNLYWGGIFTNPAGDAEAAGQAVGSYYQPLVGQPSIDDPNVPIGDTGPWPWQGVNVHFHDFRDAGWFGLFFATLVQIRTDRQDTSELIVGEWGIKVDDETANPPYLAEVLSSIDRNVDRMFAFTHAADPADSSAYPFALVDWSVVPNGGGPGTFVITGQTGLYMPFQRIL